MPGLHTIKVSAPDARGVLTTVTVDGEELRGVTSVGFHIDMDHNAVLTLTLYADLIIEGEAEIIRTWKQGLPWWRRLPYWLGAR